MIIKGYIPLLFSKEVSTTQPQSLATNKMGMKSDEKRAKMTSRGHVTSKAPMAVRDSPVKSYSFHTHSSLISLVLNRLLTDKHTEDKERHFFHVRTRRKS